MGAATWLELAQDAADDGGVVGRYNLRSGWTSSYPETTGYIIPTLLKLESVLNEPRFRDRAARCVDFLLSVQLDSGAFPGLEIAQNRNEPSIFNSAQIIGGLVAWHRASNQVRALQAAERSCEWIISQQDSDGAWRKFLYGDTTYTYMAHAACWIAELGEYLQRSDFLDAARIHLEWVLKHQDAATGFFDKSGFTAEQHQQRRARTHTIAYTIWGVLMISRILGYEPGMHAARKVAMGVARRLELSRWLPGILDHRWRGCAQHACLTGNAQMALIWLELHRLDNDPMLMSAACKALDLVKRAQPMRSRDPGIRGGIAGSDPVWGNYISMSFPNWAAKFFIDALIERRDALDKLTVPAASKVVVPHGLPTRLPEIPADPGKSFRIVLYASPNTHKVQEMMDAWSLWGFRPAAVVITQGRKSSILQRIIAKLRNEGIKAVFGRLVRRRAQQVPSAHGMPDRAIFVPTVREYCRRMDIPVIEVKSLESEAGVAAVEQLAPDLAIHAGGGILRKPILDIPRLGTLNAHMGILPKYRGMNVTEWSRLAGDPVGCTVHLIDPGIDTGDILLCRAVPLDGVRNIAALRDAVNAAQIEVLGEVVRYCCAAKELSPRYPQTAEQGRQYFVLHPELHKILDRALQSAAISP